MKKLQEFFEFLLVLALVGITSAWAGFVVAGIRWLFVRDWGWTWFWVPCILVYACFGLMAWNSRHYIEPRPEGA